MGEQKLTKAIIKPKILLVEGKDEEILFAEILKVIDLDDIQVIEVGGSSKFHPSIKNWKSRTGSDIVTSIGVVRDADNDPQAAFQSVCSGLQGAGLPIPEAPLLSATNHKYSVTILIVPGTNKKGMIENVCLNSVSDDPAMECVDQFFECLEIKHRILFEDRIPKSRLRIYLAGKEWVEIAHFEGLQKCVKNYLPDIPSSPAVAAPRVHAFLASRYTPDLDLGIAAQKSNRDDRYWNLDHPAFDEIKRFLRML
jgi:hypothetical protein